MTAAAGLAPLYRRRVSIAVKTPLAIAGQTLTPVLWVLVVAPALASVFGGFAPGIDYYTYLCLGQIVFVLPFSAMFAGLTVIFDRDWGILREFLVAPIRRPIIPLANTAAVLTVGAGQFLLIITLGVARGAHFHTTLPRLALALAAAALLTAGVYGLAEYLAYAITQPQIFGTLIPAIGATPYLLCGALFPIAALPAGIEQVAYALPWTHCLDLLRFGLMGDAASGLDQIWPVRSAWPAAMLSLAVLAAFAAATQALAQHRFSQSTID
jgi:ABC-2 type transport system permease protein